MTSVVAAAQSASTSTMDKVEHRHIDVIEIPVQENKNSSNSNGEAEECTRIDDDHHHHNNNNKDDDNVDHDEDDDEMMDAEQLEEYQEMIEQLGSFPDKVKINSLTMVAEDCKDSPASAQAIYGVIRKRLMNTTTNPSNVLPLVYLIDSILKNVRGGVYVRLIEEDAHVWMPVVYQQLLRLYPPPQQQQQLQKLEKVWKTWNDSRLFKPEKLAAMGTCFQKKGETTTTQTALLLSAAAAANLSRSSTGEPKKDNGSASASASNAPLIDIPREKDGTLILSSHPQLRSAMEDLLDQLQSDMDNELDKISLERLASIDPDLFHTIQRTAMESLEAAELESSSFSNGGASSSAASLSKSKHGLPSYYTETRSAEWIQRFQNWMEYSTPTTTSSMNQNNQNQQNQSNFPDDLHDLSSSLRAILVEEESNDSSSSINNNNNNHNNRSSGIGWNGSRLYTQSGAKNMTQWLACVLASAHLLETTQSRINKEQRQQQQQQQSTPSSNTTTASTTITTHHPGLMQHQHYYFNSPIAYINPALFTNKGLLIKNAMSISMLYEVGLPFVSSVDGRRFASQIDLSHHLDQLFRQSLNRRLPKPKPEQSSSRTEKEKEQHQQQQQHRGWLIPDVVWTGEMTLEELETERLLSKSTTTAATDPSSLALSKSLMMSALEDHYEDGFDTNAFIVPADERRDRCVVCGKSFKMVFDNEDGIYKYKNCRQILMLTINDNDNDDEKEEDVLVHVSCWRGLGSTEVVTRDQALYEVLRQYGL